MESSMTGAGQLLFALGVRHLHSARGVRRLLVERGVLLALLGLLALPQGLATAQELSPQGVELGTLEPKRSLPPEVPLTCSAVMGAHPTPITPTPGAVAEAERLRASAQQATLLGELARARSLLEEAILLDPTSAQLAYHYARLLESLGESTPAFEEFCRYLTLAPESPEKEEIARHAAGIAPLRSPYTATATTAFTTGLQHFDAGEHVLAVAAFTMAVEQAPEWPSAYFNRALALLARDSLSAAAVDLESYLVLAPEAMDRVAVERLREILTAPPLVVMVRRFSPTLSLVSGIFVPGLGQFYTRRAAPGLLALAAVGGATYLALRPGSPAPYPASTSPAPPPPSPRKRPYLAAGLGAAGAVTLLSAIEAALYAAKAEMPERVGHSGRGQAGAGDAEPSALKLGADIHLAPPAIQATPGGLRADIGVRFRVR